MAGSAPNLETVEAEILRTVDGALEPVQPNALGQVERRQDQHEQHRRWVRAASRIRCGWGAEGRRAPSPSSYT